MTVYINTAFHLLSDLVSWIVLQYFTVSFADFELFSIAWSENFTLHYLFQIVY